MADLLARSQWRYLRRHPWLLWLALLGVALGVAGVVSMDIAIQSCRRAFQLSQQRLNGAATHWLVGAAGVDEELYRRLRLERGLESCAPVLEGALSLRRPDGSLRSFRVLGLDPFAEGPFRGRSGPGEGGATLDTGLYRPGAVAMLAGDAASLGLKPGMPLPAAGPGKLFLAQTVAADRALQGLLICDLSSAQIALHQAGRLSRIELILDDSGAAALKAGLPTGLELIRAETRSLDNQHMSQAFFLNLQALSLLSLVVGLFLIYNVMHFLTLQRRPWMGQLRLLGVTGAEIRAQILSEAAWLGCAGSLLGAVAGIALSRLLLPLLVRTINDLYYGLEVSRIEIEPAALLRGCLLGWLCAVAAAWAPAQEIQRADILAMVRRSPLEGSARNWTERTARWCLPVLLLSLLALAGSEALALNLAAMFGLMLGSAGLVPWALLRFQKWLLQALPSGRWFWFRFVLGGVERSLSRLGVALVAMTISLSAVLSITLMVHSFRLSLVDWLGRTLRADLYIGQTDRHAARAGQALPDSLADKLRAQPGVSRVIGLRSETALFRAGPNTPPTPVQLIAEDLQPTDSKRFRLLAGSLAQAFQPRAVLVSEPFARRYRLHPGSDVSLNTPQGWKTWRVAAIFQDYASDSGYLLLERSEFRKDFAEDRLTSLGIYLNRQEEEKVEALRQQVLSWPQAAGLEVRSQQAIRQLSVRIFEQTFQVTRVLQVLAVLVAGAGVLGAVAASQLERRREFALWHSLGLTRREVGWLSWAEAGWCALWSGLAAWPCGLLQAWAMVYFINRRAFGWTLDFHLDPAVMLATPALALLAASAAVALLPRRDHRPAEDLRHE